MKSKAAIADLFGDAPEVVPSPMAVRAARQDARASERERNTIDAATPTDAIRALASRLPPGVHLGTSSWSFPGWQRLVYADVHSEVDLSRRGLTAYAEHPLLRAVSIDRTFYAPLSAKQFAVYAKQVPDHFRFIVKAPSQITAPWLFGEPGSKPQPNPEFLSADLAVRDFIGPAVAGLGEKIGSLVLQFSPVGRTAAKAAPRFAERLNDFLSAMAPHVALDRIACEVRDAPLLTADYFAVLNAHGAHHCIGIHPRMPTPLEQAALAGAAGVSGPLVARWNLHAGYGYEEAKSHYAPFDKIVDADLATREALADLAQRALSNAQPVYITINNKAEGSAPRSVEALAEAIAARLESADHTRRR